MDDQNPYRDELNPYSAGASGSSQDLRFGAEGEIILPPEQRRGLIGHVPAIGVLMIIQGVFQLLLGIAFIVLAFVAPAFLAEEMQNNPAFQEQQAAFTPGQLRMLITAVYGGMGVIGVIISMMLIIGGVKVRRFRSHTFGIVALCAGLFSIFGGCYCFPTALALGIYGLIVLLNDPVKMAFRVGAADYSAQQIKDLFRDLPK